MTTYQALGTRVLLKVLPQPASSVLLPDGAQRGGVQRFEVMSVGRLVNQEGFKLGPGDIVQLSNHPNITGIDPTPSPDGPLVTVDRSEIAVIVQPGEADGH